ncbi:hypothetical protein [Microbacterium sp. cf046]|uniref:hypothetical protein n=1 Tax=Microbacterium sp. cf046 TaxID=1761803 RepID=UPI001113F164|nr:hypothetical protein [Microbacterium sp. cf046]
MSDSARRSRTILIALIAGVALVVVIALIAVFARGGPAQYAADTPEGVVQRYSQAVVDGDVSTALTYLVPEIADTCDRIPVGTDDMRITLLETTERDDTARVQVLVVTVYGSDPLGSSEYESEEVFELVRAGGDWLIETVPWSLAVCVDGGAQ